MMKESSRQVTEAAAKRTEELESDPTVVARRAWMDVTSYSQSDTARIPTTWGLTTGSIKTLVHRHRDYGPDTWLLTATKIGLEKVVLKAKDVEEAKLEAVDRVVKFLRAALRDLGLP